MPASLINLTDIAFSKQLWDNPSHIVNGESPNSADTFENILWILETLGVSAGSASN